MLSTNRTSFHTTSLLAESRINLFLGFVLRVGDVVLFVASGMIAFHMRFKNLDMGVDYIHTISRGMLFSFIVLNGSSTYRSWHSRAMTPNYFEIPILWLLVFSMMAVSAVAIKDGQVASKLWWPHWLFLSIGGSLLLRMTLRAMARWVGMQRTNVRASVVVGANPDAQRLVDVIRREESCSIEIRGWFATHADRSELTGAPRLGGLDMLGAYVESHNVDLVWLALPMREQTKITYALNQLKHSSADIKLVPDLFGLHLLNHSVGEVAGLPVITLQQTPLHGEARIIKAVEDRLLSSMILIMISPLLLIIAVAVKLSSEGPIFYRQERVSCNNKKFWMYKFRSMPLNAEQKSGAVWAKAGESRSTRVGAFLRKTSLDELPQFFNVLIGDMSIVGPRPERPMFVEQFKHEIPYYMKKHMVKAGITGWAQINGWRGSTDLAKRIECDIWYIQNWSLKFDLQIIFMTLFKGFVNKNAY